MLHLAEDSRLMAKLGALLPKCVMDARKSGKVGYRESLTKVCYDFANGCYVASNGGLLIAVHCKPANMSDEDAGKAKLDHDTYECISTRVLTNSPLTYVNWRNVVPDYEHNARYHKKEYRGFSNEECHLLPFLDLFRDFSIKVADRNRKILDEVIKVLDFYGLTVYACGPNEPFIFRWDFESGEYIELVAMALADTGRDPIEDGIHRLSLMSGELEKNGFHVDLSYGNVVDSSGNVSEKRWSALVTVEVTTEGFPCDYIVANVHGNVDEVETQLHGLLTLSGEGVSKSA